MNWDTRQSRITHYERACGCCKSRQDAIEGVFNAIVDSGVIPRSSCTVPAKSRFGSAVKAMVEQTPSLLVSDLLLRCFEKAFPRYDSGLMNDRNEDDEDTRDRKYIRGKVHRSKKALSDWTRTYRTVAVSFALKPVQWLWARIQHLDGRDSCLLDVVGDRSPFQSAQS
eukprot:4447772-Pyramimonas_sp.AAC.1